MAKSWLDQEPGLTELRIELGCIAARARARAGFVLLLALLVSAAGAALAARSAPTFTSRVVMKLRDELAGADGAPLAPQQLIDNLNNAVLTRAALLDVMREHDLYPTTREKAFDLALKDMREHLQIDVIQAYFPGREDTLVRSTELSLSYTAADPELALRVARALGRTVAANTSRVRYEAAEDAVGAVAASADEMRDELERSGRREAELREAVVVLDGYDRLAAALELRRVERSARALAQQLDKLQELGLRGSELLDSNETGTAKLGLEFDLLDPGSLARPPSLTRGERLALTFGLLLLVTLPSFGVLIGLVDSRIGNAAGLRRLGLRSIGHIPPFPGDHLGSLEARMRAKKA